MKTDMIIVSVMLAGVLPALAATQGTNATTNATVIIVEQSSTNVVSRSAWTKLEKNMFGSGISRISSTPLKEGDLISLKCGTNTCRWVILLLSDDKAVVKRVAEKTKEQKDGEQTVGGDRVKPPPQR